MTNRQANPPKGIVREIRVILKRARQVWRLIPRRHKLALGLAALVMALTSACNTALPLLLGKLVDRVTAGAREELAHEALYRLAGFYLVLIALAYLLREGLQVVRRYLVENSCTRIEKVMTIKLVSHLLITDLAFLTHEKVGALHGRISRSVVGFIRFLRLAFLDFFPPVLTGVFALVATLSKQPWLALAMAGVIPVSVFLTVRQLISQKGVRLALMRSREAMDGTVVEQLGGIDYVRAANTHHREVERVAKAAEKRRARENRHHFQMSLFGCAKALNEGFFHILVITLAIYLALQGRIEMGEILAFSILFLNVMAPLNEIHRALDEGQECSLQVADLLEMLSEPTDRSFSPDQTAEPRLRQGESIISVENLQVEYTTADGERKRALDGLSMAIHHGETIGVAGRSGGGKSTWLRVLMRLTHPSAGTVRIGGVPLESVSRDAIGRLIGYVGQFPFVFSGTIAENIAYGTDSTSEADIRRAARLACIHDEIMAMPGGYAAKVAEKGQNLSGGQRQRIALARIFLKNPPILILDEGTSALDTISERNVQRAISAAREDRTVVLVAHRLSTLLDADRILVFDNSRIVEAGSYGELLQRGGTFTELARHAEDGQAGTVTSVPAEEEGRQAAAVPP
jgi:ATP-binding cassette subfamily B protein